MTVDDTVTDVPNGWPDSLLDGRYVIGRRLGYGGMAEVFEAHDHLLSRSVAIKLFRVDASAEERSRIDSEMRTLASLRHHGLVTVFDAGSCTSACDEQSEGASTPFLVMELVTGPTLRRLLRDGPLPAPQAAAVGAELAATLAYIHANGIVHRDVKPANILLDPQPSAVAGYTTKLADFGIARALHEDRLTAHGTTVGTANYLSPEQARGGPIESASDIYSLGLVLIECLTGTVVYPGSGVEAAMLRLHRPPVVPARFGPGWSALLRAMTDDDPAHRPTAEHVTDRIASLPNCHHDAASASTPTAILTGAPSGSTAVLPPVPSTRGRAGGLSVAAMLGAALVLAVLLVVALAPGTHSTTSPPPKPVYPAVSGQLGTDLRQLESDLP